MYRYAPHSGYRVLIADALRGDAGDAKSSAAQTD